MTADELRARIIASGEHVTLADTISEPTLALVLGIATRTLRDRRARGDCPAFHVVGNRIFFSLADILTYLASRRFDPNAKANGESRQNAADRGR